MKTRTTDVLESPARLQEAFDRLRPELARMRKKSLEALNVDPISAASIIRAALPRVRAMRGVITKELASYDPSIIDRLDQYSLALIHAHRQCVCAKQPPAQLQELVDQVRSIREQLQSDVVCLANRGLIKDYRRAALRSSTSYRNLAADVLTLAGLLRKSWPTISNRSAVTTEELGQAESVANELILVLGTRDRSPEVVAQAALERQKVYTLCRTTYDQLRKAVTVVRWEHGDADKLTPSLHGPRRARRKPKQLTASASVPPITSVPNNDPF